MWPTQFLGPVFFFVFKASDPLNPTFSRFTASNAAETSASQRV